MNPFTVLGLEETADDEAVRAAYLAAVRRSPPDRDPEGFRHIREAYEALQDYERRLAGERGDAGAAPRKLAAGGNE